MQVVGGKALLSAGRGSHLLLPSCSSLFVVLCSPIRSRSRWEGGQSILQLLGMCLGLLCPGQRDGWWLSCRFLGTRSLTHGCASTALPGAAGCSWLGLQSCRGCEWDTRAGEIPLLQAGHHRWAGLSPCPNLSPVLLLFCSLCLTNSLGFSWFLFQLLPSFCRFSTFPVPPFAALCCQDPQRLPTSSQIPFPFRWLQRCFGLLAVLPDSGLKHSLCGWVAPELTQTATGRGWQEEEHSWLGSGCGAGGCGAAPFPSEALCWLILPRCLWAGEGLAGGLLASH